MFIFKESVAFQNYLKQARKKGKSIGFVPTMGALHQGHTSLIQQAASETQVCVCSIFVNPTQFDDKEDLERYPRTMDKDLGILLEQPCDVVFAPEVNHIYPDGTELQKTWMLEHLEEVLEGASRPGHFQGVAQVVNRLLEITRPDILYLGQKDYQQVLVIQKMIELEGLNVTVTVCPIVREKDGLAVSSRNRFLDTAGRARAAQLFKTLSRIKEQAYRMPVKELARSGMRELTAAFGQSSVDYLEILNARSFKPATEWQNSSGFVACAAIRLGSVRLIDNVIIS